MSARPSRIGALAQWVGALKHNPLVHTAVQKERRQTRTRRMVNGYGFYLSPLTLPLAVGLVGLQSGADVGALFRICVGFLAFVQVIYAAVRASSGTAPMVAGERVRGTLQMLALTRINSAEYADGAALTGAGPILRELTMLLPVAALIGLQAGADLPAVLFVWLLSCLVAVLFAYLGVAVSTSCRGPDQALSRALTQTLMLLLGPAPLFMFGGFVVFPLFLAHPFLPLALAIWAPGWARWVGPLLSIPAHLALIREARRRAISAVEHVPLS